MKLDDLPIEKRLLSLAAARETEETCEQCGGNLVELIRINKLICPSCEEMRMEQGKEKQIEQWTEESWRAQTWSYFNEYSVLREKEIKKAGFKNYITEEEQVFKAKEKAKKFIQGVLSNESPHMILSGAPGRGKSHLAMATLRSTLEMSKYTRKGLYVHYASFLDLVRESFDQPDKKMRVSKIKDEMTKCDVLVLDDLGVDLGSIDNPKEATHWNMERLNLILEARENKPLIVTTNFDEAKIRSCYGERNYSRMFRHSKGMRIEFNNVTDKRLEL